MHFLLVVPVLLCCLGLWCPGAARADKLQTGPVPVGLGMQLKGRNANPETLDAIKALGLSVVRKGFIWEAIERKPGQFDFLKTDVFVAACHARGLRILGAIAFGNDKLYGPVTSPRGRRAYARFAAKLAERYADEDIVWELWNEPNTRTFWGRHGMHNSEDYAQEYTALVREATAAMRKVAPEATVVAGSVSSLWKPSYAWQRHCFAKGMDKVQLNGWSLHPYGFDTPEGRLAGYQQVREILAKGGGAKLPLLNSESGYKRSMGGPEQQAALLARQYLVDQLAGMRMSVWYEWDGRDGFGIHDRGGKESPALVALKTLLSEIKGYRLATRMETASADDFILVYKKPKAAPKLVLWTTGSPHRLKLPEGVEGPVQVTALSGEQHDVQPPAAGGSLSLQVGAAPRFVRVKSLDCCAGAQEARH